MSSSEKSSAPAHPSTGDHDDTVEAQFSGLERLRPCACMDGCSLAALSSPSTTLMARSSSTSACLAAAARNKLACR
jgi:hypothetical protein